MRSSARITFVYSIPFDLYRVQGKKPDLGFYLFLQTFDPVSVGSLTDRQGPLHLPVAGPQAVCLGLLPPTALTHTRGLLRLRQLSLLPDAHTHRDMFMGIIK